MEVLQQEGSAERLRVAVTHNISSYCHISALTSKSQLKNIYFTICDKSPPCHTVYKLSTSEVFAHWP